MEVNALAAIEYDLNETDIKNIFETFHPTWNFKDDLDSTLRYFRRWK